MSIAIPIRSDYYIFSGFFGEDVTMEMQIGGYERLVRQRCNGLEAVQITWPSGTRTPKHNHYSHGWVWVLKGQVFEVRDGQKHVYREGDSFLEISDGTAHIVGNDAEGTAITFHVYKPELKMDIFDDDNADRAAIYGTIVNDDEGECGTISR